ncbi:uncharacterized protein [Porites lutea]|uniref:uncharacterized protein isoform X3 n=1 Tax=Porites lutea TaxID=51062 RepID=UPI003CC5E1E7
MNIRLLFTCLTLCLSHSVFSAPLETTEKPGSEQVHREDSKSVNLENKGNEDEEGSHIKRVKEHKVNRKPGFSDFGGNNNDYKEDTKLEDRLAMEAEEEKKYETGEGYGPGGGGGGGGAGWEDGAKGVNWATNIQRQDAAEKQSIQAQVASESAHELDEIQRAIAAESQSSRGSASIGNEGASVVGGAPSTEQTGMQPRITNPEGGGRGMSFLGGQQKGISPAENQEISNFIHQEDKISPAEIRGAAQQSDIGMGSLGARESQALGGSIGSFRELAGPQQMGGQSEGATMEQAPIGGAIDAGAMGQDSLAQAGLGGGAGLSESAISRMTEGSLGGKAGESYQGLQGLQGMQSVQDMQGMQGMQSMSSALTGGQQGQGGMLSDSGALSALQGQGMMGASLQGGMQGMMADGGGLAGLQNMGGGGDLGQQQMAFKKSTIARPSDSQRSKTHQKDETTTKHKKITKDKITTKKSKLAKSRQNSKHPKKM